MTSAIKCPSCGHAFEPSQSIKDEVEKELRVKMQEWQKKKLDDFEEEKIKIKQQFEKDKNLLLEQTKKQALQQAEQDYTNQIKLLQEQNQNNQEKLKEAQLKEYAFLKKEQELLTKEQNIDIEIQRKLLDERARITEEVRRQEEQKLQLKDTETKLHIQELEKKIADQQKMHEEALRKAKQGSMQMQGEVQELALEDLLRQAFPYDILTEVGKGVKGADCILAVRNQYGNNCGTIIFESKRTKEWSNDWIEKIKADLRQQNADVAVIVTQTMPKELKGFGMKEGVYICSFHEVKALVAVLRDGIIKVSQAIDAQHNVGDKMTLLYQYLTGNEFTEQWKAIREGFMSMRLSIQKEREAMEKLWKAREKQLEKVMINAAGIKGSIEGIAGQQSIDFNLLDDAVEGLLEP
jgi:hypothetical protein